MSRRSFSQIFKELQSELHLGSDSYESLFKKCMDNNSAFQAVTKNFTRINYGEQFFDAETGQALALAGLFKSLFVSDFWKRNETLLINLLNQGVVSTAMIRNFRPDIVVQGEGHQPAATVL